MAESSWSWTVAIDALPERVWPLVGDLGRQHEWSLKPYEVEWLSGEPNAVRSAIFALFVRRAVQKSMNLLKARVESEPAA